MTSTVAGETTCSAAAHVNVYVRACVCVWQMEGSGCVVLTIFNNAEDGESLCVIVMATRVFSSHCTGVLMAIGDPPIVQTDM